MVWHIKRRCSELICEKGSWNDAMKFKKIYDNWAHI